MRLLSFVLAATAFVAGSAFASPADPKLGVDYTQIATPQSVQTTGKKVEVVEFFMYHCPHCYVLEPALMDWVRKQGDAIAFRRVHVPSTGANDPESHLFITLEAMGKEAEMHPKILHAWNVEHLRLNNDAVIADWVGRNGIDKAKFLDFYNSFAVLTKLKRLMGQVNAYGVDSAPTLVVDGRFMTSPSLVGAQAPNTPEQLLMQNTVLVLGGLVARAQKH